MKKRFLLLLMLILAVVSLSSAATVFADFGDFNDYDDDSGWFDSDWDDDDWDSDYDSDWGGGGYYSSGSGSSGSAGEWIIAAVVTVIIIIIVLRSPSSGSGSSSHRSGSSASSPEIKNNTDKIVPAIIAIDPNFSEQRFISWAKEVFITLQTAWSKREWDSVRPFEKEELYRQHQLQIQEYIKHGRINVIDRININNAHLYEYKRDNMYEYLTLFIKARMVDYIKDENTGQVIKGDPNRDCFPRYLMTFMRKKGVLTDAATSNKSTTNCPNCGAPTQITSSGKCEYCDSIITTGDYDWVLSDIQGVKRNMTYGPGGVIINETPPVDPVNNFVNAVNNNNDNNMTNNNMVNNNTSSVNTNQNDDYDEF